MQNHIYEVTTEQLTQLSHQHPILVYDGVCILCNGYVKWLLKRDRKETFRYITMQSIPELYDLLPSDDGDTVVMMDQGKIYTYSDVGLMITKRLGGLWPIVSVLLYVPRFVRHGVYRWIARNRYRWFGKADSCLLPDPDKSHLFLD